MDAKTDLATLKRKVAEAVRTLAGGDILTLTVGHVSCRIPGSDNILILGHTHKLFKTLDAIDAEDIIEMDLDGNAIHEGLEPPGERYIHSAIYRRNPGVQAVVHAHPELSTAFGIAGKPIVPVYYRAGKFFPEVRIYDYAGQIDTPELGEKVAESLGTDTALLLRGHGTVVVGESVEDAAVSCFVLETNARIQLNAAALGNVVPIPAEEVKVHKPTSVWAYYVKRFDRNHSGQ